MKKINSFFVIIVASVLFLSVLTSFKSASVADINVTIPGIEITTVGNFDVNAAGGTVSVYFTGTADVNQINSYFESNDIDFLYAYTLGNNELFIEVDTNTTDSPIVIGISGRLGGYITITQDCY